MIMLKKVSSTILYIAFFVWVIFLLIFEANPQVMVNYTAKLAMSAVSIVLLFFASLIRTTYLEDENKKKTMKKCLCILFAGYILYLFSILFVDEAFGRYFVFFNPDMDYKLYFQYNTNFIPFKSIVKYCDDILHGELRYSMVNIWGNLFAFAPMGFFLPVLFKKMQSLKKFSLFVVLSLICVEIMQILLLTGSFDIDDIILNFTGAFLAYLFTKTKPIQSLLVRIHILPKKFL